VLRHAAAIATTTALLVGIGCGGNTTRDPDGADAVDPTGGAEPGDTGGGAAGGTAGAAGHGGASEECVAPKKQPGCSGFPICPSYWCPEALHLRVERLPEADCVFVITDDDHPEYIYRDLLQVALVLPSEDTEELLTALGGDISACAARLSENDEAWLLDSTGDQLTVTVCPCVCDRMGQEGWLDVVYGCGSGSYYTG